MPIFKILCLKGDELDKVIICITYQSSPKMGLTEMKRAVRKPTRFTRGLEPHGYFSVRES